MFLAAKHFHYYCHIQKRKYLQHSEPTIHNWVHKKTTENQKPEDELKQYHKNKRQTFIKLSNSWFWSSTEAR